MQTRRSVLFIGRFQPFHKGHEKILSHLLKRYFRVTLAIGSAQKRRTKDNPFSARERKEMIMRVVRMHKGWTSRIRFAYLADHRSNAVWVRILRARFSPSHFVIAAANPLVRRLCKKTGYTLDPSPLFKRAEWEGKTIRAKARAGRPIRSLLSSALRVWMQEKGKKIIRESG